MAKLWRAASLLALALLGCFFGTEVEAQGWQKPATPMSKGSPQTPKVPFQPEQPKHRQFPQTPQVQPPQQPKFPQAPKYPQQAQWDQSPQKPQIPQSSSTFRPSGSKQPTAQTCEVEVNVRVPCGTPDISAEACEAIDCCFDGRQCYFGKAVTLQCTKDGQFIVVVARDVTLPNIDLESISFSGQGQGCTHVASNSGFAIYQFPVSSCGTAVMEEPGVIIYENRMTSTFEVGVGPVGSITRDSQYEFLFQCRYTGTSVKALTVFVPPLEFVPLNVGHGPLNVHLRLGNGQCNTKGCNEDDVAYTSYYTDADYPVTKVLRDPVYVEVQLLERTDPLLVLTLGRCWATAGANPHNFPQWDILIDGCPNRDDRYTSRLIAADASSGLDFPGHYMRFVFQMFAFVKANPLEPTREQVYIHCSTAVCAAAPGRNCRPSCFRKKREASGTAEETVEPKKVVSVGPLIITSEEQ